MGDTHVDDADHFSLPPMVFYFLLGAAGLGGAGGYGLIGPQMEKEAIEQCFDNSAMALEVAAQHGEELNELRRLVYARTAERWTASEEAKFQQELEKRFTVIDRRLLIVEREVDKHGNH